MTSIFRLDLDRRVWLLTTGQMLLSVGRGVLMPFATLYFYDVRHFPLAFIGLAYAVAFPAGSIVGLAWGALADRIGRKPLMLLGFATQAVSTAMLAFVQTPAQFFVVVVVNQMGASAWNPAARAMIADVTPPDRRGRAYGLLYLANNLGISLGLLAGGALALFLPFRALFFAEAGGAAAFLLVVALFVRESHRRAAAGSGAGAGSLARLRAHFGGMAMPLRDRAFLLFALAGILGGIGWSQFYLTYSPYMQDFLGFPTIAISIVFAINTVMVVAFQIPIAAAVDKGSRVRAYMLANYAMAWSLLMMWAAGRVGGGSPAFWLVASSVAIMTVGEIMVVPLGASIAAGLARSEDHFGKYMAAMELTWTLSGGLGSVLGGLFFDAGRPMLLWPTATASVALSLAVFWWWGRHAPPEVDRAPQAPPPAAA